MQRMSQSGPLMRLAGRAVLIREAGIDQSAHVVCGSALYTLGWVSKVAGKT